MSLIHRLFLAGALVLVLLVAGCGSGGDTTAAAISKRVLLAKANAACAKDNEELSAAFDRLRGGQHSDEVRFAVENVIPVREEQLRRLRRLGPPFEDAERFEEILVAMEDGIRRGKQNPPSLLALEDKYAFAKAFELGLAFGLERCWLN